MHADELVSLAMKHSGTTSQTQLAHALGVSHVAVGKWVRRETCPTFEQACELAVLAGLPVVSTAASVRQYSLDGAKHRVLLRRLASLAAGVAVAFYLLNGMTSVSCNLATLYIMSTCAAVLFAVGTLFAVGSDAAPRERRHAFSLVV